MKKFLSVAALLLLAGAAQAAPVNYVLSSVTYANSFAPTPGNVASCTGCGIGTAVDDGFGNITLSGISWNFNAGGNAYSIAFGGTTTLATGTTLSKSAGHTCTNSVGSVCTTSNAISGMGDDFFYTGIGSDNLTACANDRCRVDVSLAGTDLVIAIKRALSESATSGASQTYTLTFAETTVVPVPAAVWLFASAMGVLGLFRRRFS